MVHELLERCIYAFCRVDTIETVRDTDLPSILTPTSNTSIKEHSWVRIQGGLYHHDIGQVREICEHERRVKVAVVPRIAPEAKRKPAKRVRRQDRRPTPRRLSIGDALREYGEALVRRRSNGFELKEQFIENDGFVILSLPQNALGSVRPKMHEISDFADAAMEHIISSGLRVSQCTDEELWGTARVDIETIDLDCFLRKGDIVKIIGGPNLGKRGRVSTIPKANTIAISLEENGSSHLATIVFEEDVKHVRPIFGKGELVDVRTGIHAGRTGFVVDESDMHIVIHDSRTTEQASRMLGESYQAIEMDCFRSKCRRASSNRRGTYARSRSTVQWYRR